MVFKKLLEVVAYFYNLKPDDVCSGRRKKNLVRARQVVCYFARKELKQSYPSIGKRLGNRDHTTIIHASRKIETYLEKDERLKLEVENISKLLKEKSQYLKEYFREKEQEYFLKEKAKEKKAKKDLLREIQQLSDDNLSPEHIKRQRDVLRKYEDGWTFADIARKYGLTRERIRQIATKALLYKAKETFREGTEPNLKKFFANKKERHLEKMRERYGFAQKKDLVEKEKKWSRDYDYCRKCATNSIKHHAHGYCRKCYPTSKIFKYIQKASRLRNIKKRKKYVTKYLKEYYKRPEVAARLRKREDLKNFGGNRERAILQDNERCKECGLSRQESYKKYGRDLHVLHIGSKKDNRLENLKTFCPGCFRSAILKRARRMNRKSKISYPQQ